MNFKIGKALNVGFSYYKEIGFIIDLIIKLAQSPMRFKQCICWWEKKKKRNITVNISKYRLPPRNFVVQPLPYTCIHSHRQMHTSFDLCWMKAYVPVSLSMMVFHTVCYRLVGLEQVSFAVLNPAFSIPFSPLGSTLSRLLNI